MTFQEKMAVINREKSTCLTVCTDFQSTKPNMEKIISFQQKISVIEKLTGGKGPIATAAEGALVACTSEYERHLRCVEHNLQVFEIMAWQECIREFGPVLVEQTLEGKSAYVL